MKELVAFRHEGFWQCMDHKLDKDLLDEMCSKKEAPWLKIILPKIKRLWIISH